MAATAEQLRSQCDLLAAQLLELSSVAGPDKDSAQRVGLIKCAAQLRSRYLDLIEATLIGSISEDPPLPSSGVKSFDPDARSLGLDWPSSAFSMIGAARMKNLAPR
ncbi:TylF/MycF/NovP-related O-methyltransferase [Methylacidimicrobium sp. B4]|uniref:TylF/MycF/NovP-related O-methyltransferase n=1 Tax=Methylacidimicrobium sp. B4 TaxID=2796139 RepID=UPI001A8C6004|nr:TylF/MycF/NovP-related O-methyltransferase [Methylacidimicrobium sp. B4]QSR85460.1 hypothetical protein MacB4_04300 [Methylacidimicrobium sp. B4]